MTTAAPLERPSWTPDEERERLRRRTSNDRAVKFASVVSAVAVCLGAALSVWRVLDPFETSSPPPGSPAEPMALDFATDSYIGFEVDDLRPVSTAALARIPYDWQRKLPGWSISFLEPRGQASGYTWSKERRIEVFVRPGDDADRVARVLAHEIGHAVDVTLNTPDERREWLRTRAAEDVVWWPGSGAPDFESGAGDFAEVFAFWQVANGDFRSKVNPSVDPEDIALLERLAEG